MEFNRNNQVLNNNSFLTQQEEDERERRMLEKGEAVARKVNAQQIANTLPLKGGHAEEVEKERRIQNRDENVAKKVLAQDVANMIKDGGYVRYPQLHHLEEEERQRRLIDNEESIARKSHASDVSDAIRTEAATIKARFVKRPSLWNRISHNPAEVGRVIYNNIPVSSEALGNTYGAAKNLAGGLASTAASYIPSFASLVHTAASIKDTVMHNIPFVEHPWTLADVKAAEELERQRRIADDRNSSAVGNAKRVAQVVRFGEGRPFHKAFPSGYHRHTNGWEERERTRRLANKGEMEARRVLSNKVANCLNQLGWPFIRKAKGKFPLTPSAALAEAERGRILADQNGMLHSRLNAKKVADLIKDAFNPFDHGSMSKYTRDLEEKERRHRMRHPDEAVHAAHRLAGLIRELGSPFYIPSTTLAEDMGKLDYNKAVKRPLVDTLDMANARKQARKSAKQLNKALSPKKNKKDFQLSQEIAREQPKNIDTRWMEEGERKARICDKALQQLAMDNARKVSGLINKKKGPYKERQTSFKPDSGFYFLQPATISPPSVQLAPMHRPVAPIQASTISPHSVQVAPLHHIVPLQPATISPPSVQLAPMPRTVAAPVQPAVISHPVELPSPRLAKGHTATALPGSPYPDRVHTTPLYEVPFTTSPGSVLRPAVQPTVYASPAPAPVSQFAFPEQQRSVAPVRSIPSTIPFTPASSFPLQHSVAPAPSVVPTIPASSFPLQQQHQSVAPVRSLPSVASTMPASSFPLQQQQYTPVTPPASSYTMTRPQQSPVLKPASTYSRVSSLPSSTSFAPIPVSSSPSFSSTPVARSVPDYTPSPRPIFTKTVDTLSVPQQRGVPSGAPTVAPVAKPRQAPFNPTAQQKLVESVHKLYDAENALAEKERQKMLSYQQKESGWSRFRSQRHAAAAARHSDNAKRHQDWLAKANPAQSAL